MDSEFVADRESREGCDIVPAPMFRRSARVAPLGVLIWVASCSAYVSFGQAAEVTRVVTSAGDDGAFDFHLGVSWRYENKSARLEREQASATGSASRPALLRDLSFAQQRHVVDARLESGILPGVGLFVSLPVVVSDNRSLSFDQTDASSSSLLRDGILPGFNGTSFGVDGTHMGRAFTGDAGTVFRGPTRRGIESLNVGLAWALFDQRLDDTQPTWTMGVEGKLDLFADMAYDAANPAGNTAVGLGYHQIVATTAVSRRFSHLDPFFAASFMVPIRTTSSAFKNYGGGQSTVNPSMVASALAGTALIAWEDVRTRQSVTLELRGRMDYTFAGRGRSELWEALSGSSACTSDPTKCRNAPGGDATTALDQDLDGDGRPDPYPGITEMDGYATFGGDAGLNINVGRYVKFRALFGLTAALPHFLSSATAGVDSNGDGRVNASDKREANPTYRETLDLPGRRFKAEASQLWSLTVDGMLMF